MKKFLVICLLVLSACKSITYADVNPIIKPNHNLLPPLESKVNMYNLETTYSVGVTRGVANNMGSAWGQNSFAGWGQSAVYDVKEYKDSRVNDVINIFEKEVNENITTPYGAKKGIIELKLGYRGHDESIIYPLTSTLSLCTLNMFGFPWNKIGESLEIEVSIYNNKNELIRKYKDNANTYGYVAMWWGYDEETIFRKLAADNIKQALANIRVKIGAEAKEIINKL